jgi:hypothetical protein
MPARQLPSPQLPDPPGSFLFSDEIIKELTDEERRTGIYTAERLPIAKRNAIIQLLGEQRGIQDIARIVQVHNSTVTAVADRFCDEIADIRTKLARKLRRVVWGQAERLDRYPDMLPASSIPLAIKMLTETAELLEGRATTRTEHVERVDIFADWPAFLESLEMETKNGPHGIGDAGRKNALIAGPVIDVPAEAIADPGIDCKASVSAPIPQVNRSDVPGYVPASAAAAADAIEGAGSKPEEAGGGSTPAAGGGAATDNYTQNFWPNGSFTGDVEE